MSTKSFKATSYLQYLAKRRTIQNIHSPFLFSLMEAVFDDSKKNWPSFFSAIESLRKKLIGSNDKIEFEDFGAGGDKKRKKKLSISSIASKTVKQAKYARFLYRLALFSKSAQIVELGTSLGITTAYLASADADANVYTIEADKNVQKIAQDNWRELNFKNIQSYSFDLNEGWNLLANEINKIDFLFIDANHRKEAMIRYVLQTMPYIHEQSVIVLDDIHWSEEALEAWNILKARREVTLSFDIYQMGILFFDKKLSKEDFTLKY